MMKLWDPERYRRESNEIGRWLGHRCESHDEWLFWWDFWDDLEVLFPEPPGEAPK